MRTWKRSKCPVLQKLYKGVPCGSADTFPSLLFFLVLRMERLRRDLACGGNFHIGCQGFLLIILYHIGRGACHRKGTVEQENRPPVSNRVVTGADVLAKYTVSHLRCYRLVPRCPRSCRYIRRPAGLHFLKPVG